jgi:hypothetical protein
MPFIRYYTETELEEAYSFFFGECAKGYEYVGLLYNWLFDYYSVHYTPPSNGHYNVVKLHGII